MTMVAEEVYLRPAAGSFPGRMPASGGFSISAATRKKNLATSKQSATGGAALLLTIATTPADTRRLVEEVAAANAVPLDALYGMLGVLGVDTASGDVAQHCPMVRRG